MRYARNLWAAVALALAAMTVAVPSAFAEPVQVVNADTQQVCSEVTVDEELDVSGGCVVEFLGTIRYVANGGSNVQRCDTKFNLHVDENGTGYAADQILYYNSAQCPLGAFNGPCRWNEGGIGGYYPDPKFPWSAQIKHDGSGNDQLDLVFCLNYNGVNDDPIIVGAGTLEIVHDHDPYVGLLADGAEAEILVNPSGYFTDYMLDSYSGDPMTSYNSPDTIAINRL